jgi:hypothetical protein
VAKETDDDMFIGTDVIRNYHILNEDEDTSINITGWTLSWMLKKRLSHEDIEAFLTKTVGSGIAISGTFNADPNVNAQRAIVTFADTDTDPFNKGDYFWELKRTTASNETVLAYGKMTLLRGVHRA